MGRLRQEKAVGCTFGIVRTYLEEGLKAIGS
jgi:hypothetical protein